jgi:hypothetical protein
VGHEYDEHFGAYKYICQDWAKHVLAYMADKDGGTLQEELEGETKLRGVEVENLDLGEHLMDMVSSYGIVRYSHLDDGDDCCPTCQQTIGLEDAVEVEAAEAHRGIERQKKLTLGV